MDEEYNPFQSPEAALPLTPSYLVPQSLRNRRGPRFASGHVRAVFAMAALGAFVLFDVACIGLYVSQYNVLDRIQHGEHFDMATLRADDDRLNGLEEFKYVLIIAAAIAFPMWVHRVYRNLPSLGDPVQAATPGWAAGSYFVPIANLVVPCTIMAEIWRYSDPTQVGVIRRSTSPLVGIWWALFIGRGVLFMAIRFLIVGKLAHHSLDELKGITLWAIAAYFFEIISAIVAIILVRTVDRNQQATHDLIAAQPPSEPTSDPYYG
jgi:hypothetical protein